MIAAGPIGDYESNDQHWDEKGNTMVSHIFVSYDISSIRSIQFGYSENGAFVMSAMHGPSKGPNFRVVKLNHNEYVTGLSGERLCDKGINSMTFFTNLGKHGPICVPVSAVPCNPFYEPRFQEIDLAISDRREFGGFYGSYDATQLKSIGIYMSPIPSSVVKHEKV